MKKLIIILLAATLALPAFVSAKSLGEKYDKIVTFFQGDTEPTALDATWDSKTLFKIGMIDDGVNKDDYAKYACGILYNEGLRGQGIEVRIIDIQKLAYKKKWVVLGKAMCE
jgi:hypothetical protein